MSVQPVIQIIDLVFVGIPKTTNGNVIYSVQIILHDEYPRDAIKHICLFVCLSLFYPLILFKLLFGQNQDYNNYCTNSIVNLEIYNSGSRGNITLNVSARTYHRFKSNEKWVCNENYPGNNHVGRPWHITNVVHVRINYFIKNSKRISI